MSDKLPSVPPEPCGNQQPAAKPSGHKEDKKPNEVLQPSDTSNGKNSTFPPSARVEFAGALGLVVWVWSEMMDTHDVKKLSIQFLILAIFYVPVCYYT